MWSQMKPDGDDDGAGQRVLVGRDLLEEIVDIGFEPAGLREGPDREQYTRS